MRLKLNLLARSVTRVHFFHLSKAQQVRGLIRSVQLYDIAAPGAFVVGGESCLILNHTQLFCATTTIKIIVTS